MSYRVIDASEAQWRPSNQMRTLNTDLGRQLGATQLGARLWRLRPGQASTRHRHRVTEEIYVVLEGTGRLRVGEGVLTLTPLSAVLVEPRTTRQPFNDTDSDQLWLIVGAPNEAANTLEMTEKQLRDLYPDGARALPPELGGGEFVPADQVEQTRLAAMSDAGAEPPPPRKRTPFERVVEPMVASRPGAWFFVNVAPSIDRRLIAWSGGRVSIAGPRRVGLLRVRGAKTGITRQTPLVYTSDGDRVLLIASRGGDVKHPAWYRNLLANPDVSFEIRGEERPFRARVLEGAERERAWRLACDTYSGYIAYQRRAGDRLIPVVALEPAAAGG